MGGSVPMTILCHKIDNHMASEGLLGMLTARLPCSLSWRESK